MKKKIGILLAIMLTVACLIALFTVIAIAEDLTEKDTITISYMNSQDIYISPRNEYSVYVKNNTSERINILFRAKSSGEGFATRVAAGKGRIADLPDPSGRDAVRQERSRVVREGQQPPR